MSKKMIITISDELHKSLGLLAKKMGVSIPEYVRFLIMKAQESDVESKLLL